jgi:hypothetical protein
MTILEDFQLHLETISSWISSCTNPSQLPVCKEAVRTLIVEKFEGKVDRLFLEIEATELFASINTKAREINYYSDITHTNAKQLSQLQPTN